MKKILFGTALGLAAGALGYKLYKDNEEEVNEFLREKLHYEADFEDFDDEDFELEDLEALRDTIEDLIDRKNARDFDGDEEADDDLDSFVVSMQDFDKEEPKLEKVVEETKVIAATKAKEEMNNESTKSKVIIAALSILVFIMVVLLIYKFNDRLKEDNRYKDTIRDYCEQLAKKEEKQQRENVAKEINSKDLDNIKFKKVTCEYNEPDKLSKKDLKNNDSGYLYVVSIKKDGKVSYTKEILVMKSNDKWFAEEK